MSQWTCWLTSELTYTNLLIDFQPNLCDVLGLKLLEQCARLKLDRKPCIETERIVSVR